MGLGVRVLSVAKRGLRPRFALIPRRSQSQRLFCNKPLVSNPLLIKLNQESISRVKTVLDSEDNFTFKCSDFSWDVLLTTLKSSSPAKAHLVIIVFPRTLFPCGYVVEEKPRKPERIFLHVLALRNTKEKKVDFESCLRIKNECNFFLGFIFILIKGEVFWESFLFYLFIYLFGV